MYWNGMGVSKDAATAMRWYREAAEEGHPNSQFHMGVAYANAIHVARDDSLALEWMLRSAKQGDAQAQYQIGRIYANGIGVQRDDATAFFWLTLAYRNGEAAAEEALRSIAPWLSPDALDRVQREAASWTAVKENPEQ
jgi:hypothetical protein